MVRDGVCVYTSFVHINNAEQLSYILCCVLNIEKCSLFSFFTFLRILCLVVSLRHFSHIFRLALQCECCMLFRHSHAPLWSTDTRISLQPNNWQVSLSLSLSFKHTELSRRKILIVISFVWIECGRECVVGWLAGVSVCVWVGIFYYNDECVCAGPNFYRVRNCIKVAKYV